MKCELMFLNLGGSKFQCRVAECSALHSGETGGVEVKRTTMMIRVLYTLEFMERFVNETKEKGV